MRLTTKLKGVVLAGGKSTRYGSDKAFAVIEGQTMARRAIELIREFDDKPVVIARGQERFRDFPTQVIKDLIPDCGPLGGIYTAMKHFPGRDILVLTCDMPYLSAKLLWKLSAVHRDETWITIYGLGGGRYPHQPFPGIYSFQLLPAIELKITSEGSQSMQSLIESASTVTSSAVEVLPYEAGCTDFANINQTSDQN